ncbi:unnamed protein product [Durusdinium trenchii]|uniref:Uncharacterized protein n=1 Tax=Durusdinium trenchii TaxID=1381693 RepID=A0ABP0LSX0_9DINO
MIPPRSPKEAQRRHKGQLVHWDASEKIGFVQLQKPVINIDVAELTTHDMRKPAVLAEGQWLNFLIGIEPQAHEGPALRCADAVKSRSRSPHREFPKLHKQGT